MNRFEKRRTAIDKSIREQIDEYKAVYKKADEEDRDPTDEERLDIESHLKAIEVLRAEKEEVEANIKTLEHVDDIGRQIGPETLSPGLEAKDIMQYARPTRELTPGGLFVTSPQFKAMQDEYRSAGRLPQGFSTGAVTLEAKGTLLEGAGAPGSGTGGGLIPVPQVLPGVVEKLFQPLRIADLLLSGQVTTNSLRYVVEGTATSGAAGVAEAGNKPESTLALSTVDEPVKKVATVLTVSDEMLEDAAQVESYINGRLSLFVTIEEERQLVLGAGTNELVGVTGRTGVNTYARGTVDNNAIALFKAMNGQRGSAFLEPDFFVLNPANWQATRLLQDTNGQFYGGGPFTAAYGGPSGGPVGQSGQISGVQDSLWGKPVIVTTAIGAGTALIGTQAAAQVWRRGGLSVEATNSHASYFTANLVAIRAEQRLALAVYRPVAFTMVTGLQ